MKKVTGEGLLRFFYLLLLLFPFLLGSVYAVVCLLGGWEPVWTGHDLLYYMIQSPFPNKGRACVSILLLFCIAFFLFRAGDKLFLSKRTKRVVDLSKKYDPGDPSGGAKLVGGLGTIRRKQVLGLAIWVCIVALVPRLFLAFLFGKDISLFSDFALSWQLAKGNLESLGHYRFFPAYLNYAVLLRALAHVSNYEPYVIFVFNAFVTALTATGIVLLADAIFHNPRIAHGAALLYAMYPPAVFYVMTATPEHVCVLGLVFAAFFIVRALQKAHALAVFWQVLKGKNVKGPAAGRENDIGDIGAIREILREIVGLFVYTILGGVCAGLATTMKAFFPVLLVALVISLCFLFLKEAVPNKYDFVPDRDRKKAVRLPLFVTILLFVLVLCMVEHATERFVEKTTGRIFEITIDSSDALPHFVTVGLNHQGEGQIHLGAMSHYYTTLRENGVEQEVAWQQTVEALRQDWEGKSGDVFSFLMRKTIWAWQDDDAPVRNMVIAGGLLQNMQAKQAAQSQILLDEQNSRPAASGRTGFLQETIIAYLSETGDALSQIMYLILMGLGFLGILSLFSKEGLKNIYFLFTNLLVFGFFALMLLAECQSRYKCLILPFVCIAAVGGLFSHTRE